MYGLGSEIGGLLYSRHFYVRLIAFDFESILMSLDLYIQEF